MSKIDTQVRHVTKPGTNLFTELSGNEFARCGMHEIITDVDAK